MKPNKLDQLRRFAAAAKQGPDGVLGSVVNAVPVLCDEVEKLTAELRTAKGLLAGLHKEMRDAVAAWGQAERERDEARAKVARDHDELRDKRTDLLNIRGILKPAPGVGDDVVPMQLGDAVAPAVEWLAEEYLKARAALDRVQKVHAPELVQGELWCPEDDERHPCTTWRAGGWSGT